MSQRPADFRYESETESAGLSEDADEGRVLRKREVTRMGPRFLLDASECPVAIHRERRSRDRQWPQGEEGDLRCKLDV